MRHASAIRDHLEAVEAVQTRPTTTNAFHIRVRSRIHVGRSLERASIGAGEHVPVVRARQLRTGMLANMVARSCKLLGVDACSSIDAQRERFTRAGFTGPSQVITMTDFYRTKMHAAERDRIESIEFLDESELLFQLMDHYCICVVTNSSDLGDILF